MKRREKRKGRKEEEGDKVRRNQSEEKRKR